MAALIDFHPAFLSLSFFNLSFFFFFFFRERVMRHLQWMKHLYRGSIRGPLVDIMIDIFLNSSSFPPPPPPPPPPPLPPPPPFFFFFCSKVYFPFHNYIRAHVDIKLKFLSMVGFVQTHVSLTLCVEVCLLY